jgi:hypothetical protein
MNLKNIAIVLSLFGLLTACGGGGNETTVPKAQPVEATFADIGSHIVHFSAQSTNLLPKEVARAYDIIRSKNRAMLNVSIIEKGSNKAATAVVTVRTVNLTGQLKNVVMVKRVEQEAIYYIGVTPVANRETLIFDISVKPEGEEKVSRVRFKRQFYSDQ